MVRKVICILIVLVFIVGSFGILTSCYRGDPFPDGYFERIFVGLEYPPLELPVGGGYFASPLRVRTAHGGMGVVALGHTAITPLHSGTGSFDYTGGLYENRFLSDAPVFAVEDM